MPTEKSTSIENVLTDMSEISRQEASSKSICTWCKNPIKGFRDKLSEEEYHISGFCQICQDKMFGE